MRTWQTAAAGDDCVVAHVRKVHRLTVHRNGAVGRRVAQHDLGIGGDRRRRGRGLGRLGRNSGRGCLGCCGAVCRGGRLGRRRVGSFGGDRLGGRQGGCIVLAAAQEEHRRSGSHNDYDHDCRNNDGQLALFRLPGLFGLRGRCAEGVLRLLGVGLHRGLDRRLYRGLGRGLHRLGRLPGRGSGFRGRHIRERRAADRAEFLRIIPGGRMAFLTHFHRENTSLEFILLIEYCIRLVRSMGKYCICGHTA